MYFLLDDPISVRLSGSSFNGTKEDYEGRVEVLYNGVWGTICDDMWDINDAHVVCRMLGYPLAIQAPSEAAYGQGTGPIWLDNVDCSGHENSLNHCFHRGWGNEICIHAEDASVVCACKYVDFIISAIGLLINMLRVIIQEKILLIQVFLLEDYISMLLMIISIAHYCTLHTHILTSS